MPSRAESSGSPAKPFPPVGRFFFFLATHAQVSRLSALSFSSTPVYIISNTLHLTENGPCCQPCDGPAAGVAASAGASGSYGGYMKSRPWR